MKVSPLGSNILKENFDDFEKAFSNQAMLGEYIKFLHSKGIDITIRYARGKWFDLDSKEDLDVFEKKIIS